MSQMLRVARGARREGEGPGSVRREGEGECEEGGGGECEEGGRGESVWRERIGEECVCGRGRALIGITRSYHPLPKSLVLSTHMHTPPPKLTHTP